MNVAALNPPKQVLIESRLHAERWLRILGVNKDYMERFRLQLVCSECSPVKAGFTCLPVESVTFSEVSLRSFRLSWSSRGTIRRMVYFAGVCERCGTGHWLRVPGYRVP